MAIFIVGSALHDVISQCCRGSKQWNLPLAAVFIQVTGMSVQTPDAGMRVSTPGAGTLVGSMFHWDLNQRPGQLEGMTNNSQMCQVKVKRESQVLSVGEVQLTLMLEPECA